MSSRRDRGPRSVVLACTAIVYLLAAFFTATFGAVQPGSEWITQAAYGAAGLTALYAAVKGGAVLRRDLRRRQLLRHSQPRLYDMATYLGGHPDLPRPERVLAVLTADHLLLDGGSRRVVVALTATRQALRTSYRFGEERPWLVAQNRFQARPADAVDIEFVDARGHPQRLTLARFRRTGAAQWSESLAAAISEAVTTGRRPDR